jgi:Condensation domain
MCALLWAKPRVRIHVSDNNKYFRSSGTTSQLLHWLMPMTLTRVLLVRPRLMHKETDQLAKLSPNKRKLLGLLLQEEGIDPLQVLILRPPVVRVPRDGELPLSFAVERRLQQDRIKRERNIPTRPQNVHNTLHWSGALDIEALERSLNEVVGRHEILRTVFPQVDGRPTQVILPELRISVPVSDLSRHPPGKRWEAALDIARREAATRFETATGPLLTARVLKLDENEYLLILVVDHIVFDGWSFDILLDEVSTLYQAFRAGGPSPLGELPIQYADYSVWQHELMRSETFERQLAYWRRHLDGREPFPQFELPMSRPRPAMRNFAGSSRHIRIGADLTKALREMYRQKGVTAFMLLLATFKALLYRYTGQDSIGVITAVANRHPLETERLIGWFANCVALHTRMTGDPSFSDLLVRVREVTLGAFTHQDIPFPLLLRKFNSLASGYNRPVPYVFFTVGRADDNRHGVGRALAVRMDDVRIARVSFESRSTEAGLGVHIREGDDYIDVTVAYEIDCLDAPTIMQLLKRYEMLLTSVAADPEQRLSKLPFEDQTTPY